MNIFITGVAGFIGSHLAEALLRRDDQVTGIDNFNPFYSPDLKKQNLRDIEALARSGKGSFHCETGDIRDATLLEKIFQAYSIDCVIHLAAMAGVRPSLADPVLYEQVNGVGTTVLLEAMRKRGIRHFIFGSSSSVYGLNPKVPFAESDPVLLPYSPYAATKRAGELLCQVYQQVYGLQVAVLRFFTVYGPRQRPDLAIRKFTELIFQDKPIPIYGDGSYRRDFTYVDDIIDGILKAIHWVSQKRSSAVYEIFNLGESETTSVSELVTLLEKATGKKVNCESQAVQPGDVPMTYADISKSKKILGYHPQIPIQVGIPRFVEWYRKTYQL